MTIAGEGQAGQILSQDTRGRVLISRERREALLAEFDDSGMSGVRFAQYLGIKYTTLAHWVRRRRQEREKEKLLKSGGGATEPTRSNGKWIEAVFDKEGSPTRGPSGALRIHLGAGAYCQVSTAAEVALAAELLGRLSAKR
jgi:hypothetical protein